MKKNKILWGVAVVALVIATIGIFTPIPLKMSKLVGGITNYDSLELSENLTVNGTTTISRSYDGYVGYAAVTTVATGTAKAVITNAGTPIYCSADGLAVYFDGTASPYAPTIIAGVGTSTTATGYSANLIASTTIATSSDTMISTTYAAPFYLASGESITLSLSDPYASASSTYFSNWDIKMSIPCWVAGG